jgi:hypothetical protein
MERYYEGDKTQCDKKSMVNSTLCICEFVEGHEQEHERVPTMLLPGVKEWDTLPLYKSFRSN